MRYPTEMAIMITALLMSLVCMGMIVCAVYFCLRLQPKERDRIFPAEQTNRIRTMPSETSAPDDDFSQFSVPFAGQEFNHLFPTDHVNSVDHIIYNSNNYQRIPTSNIENGFNQSGYGFVYPSTSRNYGFIYPSDHGLNRFTDAINDHPSNIHDISQYSSINSDHDFNQSRYIQPLKKIETPPPGYYEAILGYNDSDYIHRQNRITCERRNGAHGNGSRHSDEASGGGSGDGGTGSLSHFKVPVGSNHSSNHQLIVRNTCDSIKTPSGYSGGRGDSRSRSGYSCGRSGGNSTVNSNGRDGDRNDTGYSSRRGNSAAYSGSRSGTDSNGRGSDIDAAVNRSSKGDTGEYSSGRRGGNGTGCNNSRDGITSDRCVRNHGGRDCDGGNIGSGFDCSDANFIQIKF